MTLYDLHGQPVAEFNKAMNLVKSLEGLLGICQGLVADNRLNESEIAFLDAWLRENSAVLDEWPGNVIARRVAEVLADGHVTAEEAEDLKETLIQINGGGLAHGAVSGMSTQLPITYTHSILFEQSTFCFTGRFLYGPRRKCQQATEALGGVCFDGVTSRLSYLVIGTLASRDWAHSSFGRKVQDAIELRERGRSVQIISEDNWAQFV